MILAVADWYSFWQGFFFAYLASGAITLLLLNFVGFEPRE